jgi:hypothetical protein
MSATYPGIETPILVASMIGITTYLIVFNINWLLDASQSVVDVPKNFLLRKMAAEGEKDGSKSRKGWPSRAKSFEVFPHQAKNPKPSNWWLLFYAFRLLFRAILSPFIPLWARLNNVRRSKNTKLPS